jgi:hypothetical protein
VFQKEFEKELTLRGKVWKALLGIDKIDAEEYIRVVEKGPVPDQKLANKIQVESTRAFGGDNLFKQKVSPDKLVRVSTAFLHSLRSDLFFLFLFLFSFFGTKRSE